MVSESVSASPSSFTNRHALANKIYELEELTRRFFHDDEIGGGNGVLAAENLQQLSILLSGQKRNGEAKRLNGAIDFVAHYIHTRRVRALSI